MADAFGDARRSSRFPAQTALAVGPEPFRKLIAGASTFPRSVINAAQKQTSWEVEKGHFSDLDARGCEVRFTSMSRHREFDRLRSTQPTQVGMKRRVSEASFRSPRKLGS
jgi:hypothetical protein